ncbi:MAG: hypothetical protein AAGG07_07220 [Planctomycetota bacterium]
MRHRSMSVRRVAAALGVCAGVFVLVGCGSQERAMTSEEQAEKLRRNLTPELYNLHQRPTEVRNEYAVMVNENLRMMKQDLWRALLIDRQSRLAREPIPR